MDVNTKEKAPKNRGKCDRRKDVKTNTKVSTLLKKAIESFEERIAAKDFKPTIAEYLKLVQLEQESQQEAPKEIKVTWIDPIAKSDSEK